MAKKKVAVALSDWLLEEVDEYAEHTGLSRSAVVEEAAAAYLHARRSKEEAESYRREALLALEDMRAFAREREESKPEGETSSLELLRSLRAAGHGIS